MLNILSLLNQIVLKNTMIKFMKCIMVHNNICIRYLLVFNIYLVIYNYKYEILIIK